MRYVWYQAHGLNLETEHCGFGLSLGLTVHFWSWQSVVDLGVVSTSRFSFEILELHRLKLIHITITRNSYLLAKPLRGSYQQISLPFLY